MIKTEHGPRGHALFGHLPALRRNPLDFLTRCARQYGRIVPLRLALKPTFLILDPAEVERILVTEHRQFVKPLWLRTAAVRRLLGDGLVTADGDVWRGQRRVCGPAFQPGALARYGGVMTDIAERVVGGWRSGQAVDVQQEMARLTLDVTAQTLLGTPAGAKGEQISASLDTLMRCFSSGYSLFGLLPLPPTVQEAQEVRRLDRAVGGLIQAGIAALQGPEGRGGAEPPNLLSLLLSAATERQCPQAPTPDGEEAGRHRQVREQVKTFLAAGYESSSLVLSWALLLLAENPDADFRLWSELGRVLGDRPVTPEDVPRLTYTQAIVKETLRLYPPLWMTGRQALSRCEIGGRTIPAGALLLTSQWAVQRLPTFFAEPDAFRPERWEQPETEHLPRFAYFPFGGGPRICIGQGFAMMEMTLLLATIARRYHLTLDSAPELLPWATMTLRPPAHVEMRLIAR